MYPGNIVNIYFLIHPCKSLLSVILQNGGSWMLQARRSRILMLVSYTQKQLIFLCIQNWFYFSVLYVQVDVPFLIGPFFSGAWEIGLSWGSQFLQQVLKIYITRLHRKLSAAMMSTLSSLVAPEVVVMTTDMPSVTNLPSWQIVGFNIRIYLWKHTNFATVKCTEYCHYPALVLYHVYFPAYMIQYPYNNKIWIFSKFQTAQKSLSLLVQCQSGCFICTDS